MSSQLSSRKENTCVQGTCLMAGCLAIQNSVRRVLCTQLHAYKWQGGDKKVKERAK